ncbi:NF-kappa-B inhibitor beta [Bagarius yarrelli]|uniref:NF-kappa-B inhibitor alpha n=1 Tax=Bagarius yarrelli TaxID=175774 RepID=A0A556UER4_BAGYA|nr:NF-kappa-B inhibitor beta [Bagarius yarrelli]
MEWIHRDLSQNHKRDAGKQNPGTGLGVGPKYDVGSDKIPDDWCDSGLDSLISTEFISIDSPEPVQITAAEQPDPPDPWSSVRCGVILDGTETERLDSAIGDSINDDTVRSLSERIGTVILSESGPEVQDQRREEIFNTLSFISEDGDTCDIIKMLLEAGADVNQMDQGSGRSPLHWAVEYQSCSAVELLLRYGASVDQRSYSGHTPLYCAIYRPDTQLRELLRSAGACDTLDQEEEDDDEEEVEDDRESDELKDSGLLKEPLQRSTNGGESDCTLPTTGAGLQQNPILFHAISKRLAH